LYSFFDALFPSFIPSFIPSFVPSFIPSLVAYLIPSFMPSSIPSFLPSFILSLFFLSSFFYALAPPICKAFWHVFGFSSSVFCSFFGVLFLRPYSSSSTFVLFGLLRAKSIRDWRSKGAGALRIWTPKSTDCQVETGSGAPNR